MSNGIDSISRQAGFTGPATHTGKQGQPPTAEKVNKELPFTAIPLDAHQNEAVKRAYSLGNDSLFQNSIPPSKKLKNQTSQAVLKMNYAERACKKMNLNFLQLTEPGATQYVQKEEVPFHPATIGKLLKSQDEAIQMGQPVVNKYPNNSEAKDIRNRARERLGACTKPLYPWPKEPQPREEGVIGAVKIFQLCHFEEAIKKCEELLKKPLPEKDLQLVKQLKKGAEAILEKRKELFARSKNIQLIQEAYHIYLLHFPESEIARSPRAQFEAEIYKNKLDTAQSAYDQGISVTLQEVLKAYPPELETQVLLQLGEQMTPSAPLTHSTPQNNSEEGGVFSFPELPLLEFPQLPE
jgi:hypothetical protein